MLSVTPTVILFSLLPTDVEARRPVSFGCLRARRQLVPRMRERGPSNSRTSPSSGELPPRCWKLAAAQSAGGCPPEAAALKSWINGKLEKVGGRLRSPSPPPLPPLARVLQSAYSQSHGSGDPGTQRKRKIIIAPYFLLGHMSCVPHSPQMTEVFTVSLP